MFQWHTAVAVIRDDRGRILLVHQNYKWHFYGLPEGVIEAGETPAQAMIRETKEETGIDVSAGSLDLIVPLVYPTGEEYVAFAFSVGSFAGAPSVQDSNEISSVAWYSPDDLPHPLTPSAEAVLSGRRCPGGVGSQRITLTTP